MKKIFYILLSVTIFSGCTVKKHFRNRTEIIKDSVVSSVDTIYKETIVEIKIPGETVTDYELIVLTDTVIRDAEKIIEKLTTDTSHLETTLAYSDAAVTKGKLYHILVQKDTTLQRRYDSLRQVIIKEREIWHSSEITDETITTKKRGIGTGWIVTGIAVLSVIIYIIKKFKII